MAEHSCHCFSGLEQLPTPMLEKIIEQDLNQEVDYAPELIDYVLKLLVKRAKEDSLSIPEMQSAWNKLQKRVGEQENLGALPITMMTEERREKSTRCRNYLRFAVAVAACVALIFGAMITVQAMGVDVFGVIGKWTNSTFRFEIEQQNSANEVASVEGVLHNALLEDGMTAIPVPTWVPPEYVFSHTEHTQTLQSNGIFAIFKTAGGSKYLTIGIKEYFNISGVDSMVYEKSTGAPEIYEKNGAKFYIFENSGTWTATGCYGNYVISAFGVDTKDNAKAIIDSIQERYT